MFYQRLSTSIRSWAFCRFLLFFGLSQLYWIVSLGPCGFGGFLTYVIEDHVLCLSSIIFLPFAVMNLLSTRNQFIFTNYRAPISTHQYHFRLTPCLRSEPGSIDTTAHSTASHGACHEAMVFTEGAQCHPTAKPRSDLGIVKRDLAGDESLDPSALEGNYRIGCLDGGSQ